MKTLALRPSILRISTATAAGGKPSWFCRSASEQILCLFALLAYVTLSPNGDSVSAIVRASGFKKDITKDHIYAAKYATSFREFEPDSGVHDTEAYAINKATAFHPLGRDRPFPFIISTHDASYERAVDCLASAMVYEVGEDEAGQAAVAQVVLNRLRHPAFPNTVCAVVYQGEERATGCQFTFTCDGALGRQMPQVQWENARMRARQFLGGRIYPQIGMATHYHTEQVHPYWSDKLVKIAKVGSHLFFRWPGSAGHASAFDRTYAGPELHQKKLARFSPVHRLEGDGSPIVNINTNAPSTGPKLFQPPSLTGSLPVLISGGDGREAALKAIALCDRRMFCKVVMWNTAPPVRAISAAQSLSDLAFLYVRDRRSGVEIVLWDCRLFARPEGKQCLTADSARWLEYDGSFSGAAS